MAYRNYDDRHRFEDDPERGRYERDRYDRDYDRDYDRGYNSGRSYDRDDDYGNRYNREAGPDAYRGRYAGTYSDRRPEDWDDQRHWDQGYGRRYTHRNEYRDSYLDDYDRYDRGHSHNDYARRGRHEPEDYDYDPRSRFDAANWVRENRREMHRSSTENWPGSVRRAFGRRDYDDRPSERDYRGTGYIGPRRF